MRKRFRRAVSPDSSAELVRETPRQLPREILDRVERVSDYHRSTKLTPESVRANPTLLDPATKPNPYRRFQGLPIVQLPTKLLDAPTPSLSLLGRGLEAVAGQLRPPQDLRTLASWLFLADGLSAKVETPAAGRAMAPHLPQQRGAVSV